MSKKLYFNSIKEKKDNFFTEYCPANPDKLFASLSVNFIDDVEDEDAAKELSNQSKKWIEKYPISIMASAFDKPAP